MTSILLATFTMKIFMKEYLKTICRGDMQAFHSPSRSSTDNRLRRRPNTQWLPPETID
jgi:hypothetical protein